MKMGYSPKFFWHSTWRVTTSLWSSLQQRERANPTVIRPATHQQAQALFCFGFWLSHISRFSTFYFPATMKSYITALCILTSTAQAFTIGSMHRQDTKLYNLVGLCHIIYRWMERLTKPDFSWSCWVHTFLFTIWIVIVSIRFNSPSRRSVIAQKWLDDNITNF